MNDDSSSVCASTDKKRGYNLHRSLDSFQKTLTVKSCNMEKPLHLLKSPFRVVLTAH